MSDTTPILAIGYVRVSTDDQGEQRLGIDAQRERIAAYCTARGWTLAGMVEDVGVSARTLERPGMQRVLGMMHARTVDAVVALKLDRLTRSMADLQTLMGVADRTRCALVSVSETLDTSSAAGRLMVNMFAAIAEWERGAIAERTSQALSVKRSRGERVGRHAAIGSAAGDGARPAAEAHTLGCLRTLVMEGGDGSLRTLARQLHAAGCTSRAGTAYTPSSVKGMLRTLSARDAGVRDVLAAQQRATCLRSMQPRLDAVKRMLAA